MSRRFLLVQCCHLPHFFYIAEKLRQENPDAIIDALFPDHPQARFYAERFPIFHRTCSVSEIEQLGEYDAVILPLVNRGYKHLKKTAAKRRLGPLFEVDYSGRLHRLGRLRLFISAFYSGLKPDAGFSSFFDQFPHGLGPERVLLIESCHESLLPKAREELNRVMREHRNVVRVRRAPLRDLLRQFRGQKFDTACVFFSGKRDFWE